MQVLSCSVCGEDYQVTRGQAANPETMFLLLEAMTADHRECERYEHDPAKAALARGWRKRQEREAAKLKKRTQAGR